MAGYAGQLLAPAVGFGLQPRLFLPFGQRKAYYTVMENITPFLVFSSTLSKLDGVGPVDNRPSTD